MCCNLFLSFIYFRNWNLLIIPTLDKIRLSPSRFFLRKHGLVVWVNHEDTIFNANNPSEIIFMVVTAVQFVKGYV